MKTKIEILKKVIDDRIEDLENDKDKTKHNINFERICKLERVKGYIEGLGF